MSLKAFLKQNVIIPDNKRVVISQRMLAKDGKPEIWELRPVKETENATFKEESMTMDYSKAARKSGRTVKFDSTLYVRKLLAASVVYPNLKDTELQGSYGVVGEDALLAEMLFAEEYNFLQEEVDDFSGQISKTIEDEKDTVKNS